jgi:flagellar biosynthesis GTPase FlhF
MGAKVQSNFMSVANNKYFMYIMLFLGISTLLGFLSVRNFNAVILFVVVAFAMRYFTKNMGIIMLVAVILSNIISVKSTIEGMANNESKDVESDSDSEDDDDEDKKAAASNKAPASKNTVASKKAASKVAASNKALQEILNGQKNTNQKKETESMAPIDYKMSKDVEVDEDDDDAIDVQSTQQAAYNNLNKLIGDGGFSKMTKDTEKLMSQQENLAKAMESIGPLVQNAEKMMQGLNLDKFTGMLDKLNGMMGTGGAALKGASS